MTHTSDPNGGIADIKQEIPAPNHSLLPKPRRDQPSRFQRNIDVEVEVPEYNKKSGKLPL